jgi:hypothetical protein
VEDVQDSAVERPTDALVRVPLADGTLVRLPAEQIILMGRHQARTGLGREFGATDDLDGVPSGYQEMADRTSLKVLIKP